MARPASLIPDEYRRALPRGVREPEPLPLTATQAPPELWAALLGMSETPVSVTESTSSGLPAVGYAVTTVANGVSTMMSAAQTFDASDNETATPPIVDRPHPLFGTFEYFDLAVRCLLMRGNFVGILADHDGAGWPRQAVPVDPASVNVDTTTGIPWYFIGSDVYRFDEVLHVRIGATTANPFWGRGIIEQYRTALRGQLNQQGYGESSYRTGAVPSGILKIQADKVTQTMVDEAQEAWISAHGDGQRKPAVFGRNVDFTPLSWSPEDAEFIEARKISIAEAAYLVGLEPADLGAAVSTNSGQLIYQNINDRQLDRVTRAFSPIMQRLEQAWSDLLPGRQYVRGNAEALLRTTTRERYELHEIAQRIGLETVEETRQIERRPAITETTTTEEVTE